MSKYQPQRIDPPQLTGLTAHTIPVCFNSVAKTVSGLDSLINTDQGAIVCANNGILERWYRCRSFEAAAEILQEYHSGKFLTLQWFGFAGRK